MSAIVFEPTRVSKLRRGFTVRDVTTGITGMLICVANEISGSQQVAIQPPAEKPNSAAPDVRWIDEQTCEYVDDGAVARFGITEDIGEWDFGDPVRDTVSGLVGIITEFQLCRDGCITARIVPKSDGGANSPQPAWLSITRLQRTSDIPRAEVAADTNTGACDVRPGSGRRI